MRMFEVKNYVATYLLSFVQVIIEVNLGRN